MALSMMSLLMERNNFMLKNVYFFKDLTVYKKNTSNRRL